MPNRLSGNELGAKATAQYSGDGLAVRAPAHAMAVEGTITSLGYMLLQNTNGATVLGTMAGVITGQDPLLGPLQDNGGPTLTMHLLPGSPALDQGKSFGLTSDQRGALRPFDLSFVANSGGGDGADIGAFELIQPILNIAREGTNAILSWSSFGTGFRLQAATNLLASNDWASVSETPALANNQFFLTNGAGSARKFYRLIFP